MKTIGVVGQYKIVMTWHAMKRSKGRNVDTFNIVSAITSLGGHTLAAYEDSNTDIMVQDKKNNISVVFAVTPNKIFIVTVLHDTDIFIKGNTIVKAI